MPIDILMPALSPTMSEGNLAKWLKKEGDKIKPGEVIAEIETDKATMEIEAVDSGILAKIVIQDGTEAVKVNELIAVILEDDENIEDLNNYLSNRVVSNKSSTSPGLDSSASSITNISMQSNQASAEKRDRIFASPLAKKIAEQNSIDLAKVQGTGPRGRIIKDDVINYSNSSKTSSLVADLSSEKNYTEIPNTNIRKVIARRLLESKQQIPHFYLSIECNLDKLISFRQEMNEASNDRYKLSVNDFIIKASAHALYDNPAVNASWTDAAIIQYKNIDISVAVATDSGLITPIVKNANLKSLSEISNEMKNLAAKARENKLKPEEFQGGSFSISNLGMYGVKQFKAIVNPPQSCILAVGASNLRPIVIGKEIVVANMLDLTISCDHRVVDGAVAALFLSSLKKYIENPLLILV